MIAPAEMKRKQVPQGTETRYTRPRAAMSDDLQTVVRMEDVQVECNRLYYCQRADGSHYWKPQSPPTTPGHSYYKFKRKGGILSEPCGLWPVPEVAEPERERAIA